MALGSFQGQGQIGWPSKHFMLSTVSKYTQQKKNCIFAGYDTETMALGSFQGQGQISWPWNYHHWISRPKIYKFD